MSKIFESLCSVLLQIDSVAFVCSSEVFKESFISVSLDVSEATRGDPTIPEVSEGSS